MNLSLEGKNGSKNRRGGVLNGSENEVVWRGIFRGFQKFEVGFEICFRFFSTIFFAVGFVASQRFLTARRQFSEFDFRRVVVVRFFTYVFNLKNRRLAFARAEAVQRVDADAHRRKGNDADEEKGDAIFDCFFHEFLGGKRL